MLCRSVLAAVLAAAVTGPAWGQQFPYTAFVNSADVYVRSGPGRDYYPTDKLLKGERVEVYRHDPGGWLAIRPPRQSFSWVQTRNLDPAGEALATVNSPRAVARVGSAFSDVRDTIQVRLDKDEKVELLGALVPGSTWSKIAPPSGEFRWVFAKYVDREVPDDVAADEREAAGLAAEPRVAADRREPGVRLTSGEEAPDSQSPAAADRTPPADDQRSGSTYVEREIDRIEVELSAMISLDASAWTFDKLGPRAEALLKEGRTPIERGRAHALVDKLARFNDIKQRHDALRQAAADSTKGGPAASSAFRRVEDPRFDGIGRLSPVVSQKVGDPQYALVDATNAVISFVTPAPGVNLRPFVDKYVGVNGQRGYLTELQRQHISVQRVTVLDLPTRR